MDDSAKPKFDSLTVEELRDYVQTLGQEIIAAFDAFYLLTGITVTRASFIAEDHNVPVGDEQLTGLIYKADYGFLFDYEPVPDA